MGLECHDCGSLWGHNDMETILQDTVDINSNSEDSQQRHGTNGMGGSHEFTSWQ